MVEQVGKREVPIFIKSIGRRQVEMYPPGEWKKSKELYTGSYNAPVMTGDSSVYLGETDRICLWEFDESTGEARLEESWPPGALNASWLTTSPDGKMLYAVNGLDDYGEPWEARSALTAS